MHSTIRAAYRWPAKLSSVSALQNTSIIIELVSVVQGSRASRVDHKIQTLRLSEQLMFTLGVGVLFRFELASKSVSKTLVFSGRLQQEPRTLPSWLAQTRWPPAASLLFEHASCNLHPEVMVQLWLIVQSWSFKSGQQLEVNELVVEQTWGWLERVQLNSISISNSKPTVNLILAPGWE